MQQVGSFLNKECWILSYGSILLSKGSVHASGCNEVVRKSYYASYVCMYAALCSWVANEQLSV